MGTKTFYGNNLWHLVAGIIMAVFGVFIWFNPAATLMALALYLGVIFVVVGAGYFMASFSYQSGWYLLVGILDMLVGVVFLTNIGVSAASLPIIFALWCMFVGVAQIVGSFELKKSGLPWGWSLIMGVLGILFGFWILSSPVIGAITITALMGAYILIYGVVEIVEYFTVRKMQQAVTAA